MSGKISTTNCSPVETIDPIYVIIARNQEHLMKVTIFLLYGLPGSNWESFLADALNFWEMFQIFKSYLHLIVHDRSYLSTKMEVAEKNRCLGAGDD